MTAMTHSKISALHAPLGLMLCVLLWTPNLALAQTAVPAAPAGLGAHKRGDSITLNFNATDIELVARTMGVISGVNVVVDPRVKGQMTLISEKAVSPQVAMAQFLTSLRMQGFTMVEAAGLFKVIPEADAKLQSAAVETSDSAPSGALGGQITTQIFKLNFESANNLVTILRPLISPNNAINANPLNNSLVITDYADNLRRIARIIAALDVANATDIEVIELKNAIAVDLAPLVLRLLESGGVAGQPGAASDGGFKSSVVAEPRSAAGRTRHGGLGPRLQQLDEEVVDVHAKVLLRAASLLLRQVRDVKARRELAIGARHHDSLHVGVRLRGRQAVLQAHQHCGAPTGVAASQRSDPAAAQTTLTVAGLPTAAGDGERTLRRQRIHRRVQQRDHRDAIAIHRP